MIGAGFLHPALLWGLPLAAVPIVIHLLNRRRFQTVRWAAQQFLLAALKRNRRRLRLEQLLVLLLRTLAIALLVLLVARPQLGGSAAGVRTHHVLCVDDSASMRERLGTSDVFAAAREQVATRAQELVAAGDGDLVTLLRSSTADRPALFGVQVGSDLEARVRETMQAWRASDQPARLPALVSNALAHAARVEAAGRTEIWLFGDQRAVDWLDDEGAAQPDLTAALRRIDPEHQRLTLVAVGPQDPENLAVAGLSCRDRLLLAGVPTEIEVEVVNRGQRRSAATEVAVSIDGRSRVVRRVAPLAAGEARTLALNHTFADVGYHGVVAALGPDRFAPDNTWALAVEAAAASRVLLVDGDIGDRPDEAETYYLAAALDHSRAGIDLEVIPDHLLPDRELGLFDLIYLCNVPSPAPPVIERLEAYIEGGGGLVVFLGDQTDPRLYNERWAREGAGLLPARLVEVNGDVDNPRPVVLNPDRDGLFAGATDIVRDLLSYGRVGRWMALEPATNARVVLRAGDERGPPLLVSQPAGDHGAVLLVATTADAQWSDLPRNPAYLVMAQEMHRVAARVHDLGAQTFDSTGTLAVALDPARYRPDVVVRAVSADALEQTFSAVIEEPGQPAVVTIPMARLDGFGLFELMLAPHDGGRERRLLARNAPSAEGQLETLSAETWRRTYPAELHDRVTFAQRAGVGSPALAGLADLWRPLTLAMLAAMLLESVLAWRFGRRR
ncbi:MAG: BatA domain-containing protein [Planctomycetota bacterium]